jgi:hypothetical protein
MSTLNCQRVIFLQQSIGFLNDAEIRKMQDLH